MFKPIIYKKALKKTHKVYQVQGHHVQILHESNGPVEEQQILTLPKKLESRELTFETSLAKICHQLSMLLDLLARSLIVHKGLEIY
jgi:hypothetical protein